MKKKLTDSELILRLKQGSVKAYEALFGRYYIPLLRFVSSMIKSRSAEDICQNCFLKLWINRENLNPEAGVKSWLFTVSKNEILNHLKSKNNRTEPLRTEFHDAESRDSSVFDMFSHAETASNIRNTVDKMPSQRRTVFQLSRQEHLNNSEIADQLGLSVRTVEKHIELALKDIRKNLN